MLQAEFDVDSFAFKQVAVPCLGHCVAYDWKNDVRHQHCSAIVNGSMEAGDALRCNALVLVEHEGPDSGDVSVRPEHGSVCSECGDITCRTCTHASTPTGKPMCKNCYHDAVRKVEEEDAMFAGIDEAKSGLTKYLDGLRREGNAVKIRETVRGLHEVNDLYELIMRELAPNIERAYGMQQSLPGAAA